MGSFQGAVKCIGGIVSNRYSHVISTTVLIGEVGSFQGARLEGVCLIHSVVYQVCIVNSF